MRVHRLLVHTLVSGRDGKLGFDEIDAADKFRNRVLDLKQVREPGAQNS